MPVRLYLLKGRHKAYSHKHREYFDCFEALVAQASSAGILSYWCIQIHSVPGQHLSAPNQRRRGLALVTRALSTRLAVKTL